MSRKMYRHSRRPASRVIRGESRQHKLLEQNHARLMCVLVCFGFSFVVLALRLAEVSLVGGGDLPFKRLVSEPHLMIQAEESGEELDIVTPEVPRRDIVDRNGVVLATNVDTAALVANPKLIREPKKVAKQLAAAMSGVSYEYVYERLNRENATFVYLKRHLSPGEQEKVNALGVPGLFFEPHERRTYPFGDLMSHVVGYVDVDNTGLSGIEKQFDKRLRHGVEHEGPLTLSLDVRVQSIVQQALVRAMKEYSAIGATGIVLDIESGDVISMVSLPSFDPHEPGLANEDSRFNRATLGTYEMGSGFKTFTVAMALNHGIVGIRDGYDASQPIRVAGYTINDSHPYYRWLSVREIYAYSSNIGTVKLAMDVGMKRQKAFLEAVGMTKPVDIELPELSQPLVPSNWQQINAMTISYGHGISVSPMHMVQGIATMINGGTRQPMSLLKNGKADIEREEVISQKTSQHMRKLMRTVVEYGTAKKANIEGYRVGGKTGTAEKVLNGRYKDKAKLASLISAFPMDNPKYVIFVMIDEPKGTQKTYGYATGGWVAAPTVGEIVSRMAPLLGMQPVFTAPDPDDIRFWKEADQRNKDAIIRRDQARMTHAASY